MTKQEHYERLKKNETSLYAEYLYHAEKATRSRSASTRRHHQENAQWAYRMSKQYGADAARALSSITGDAS